MGYGALIGAAIQGGIALYSASQSPNYPNPPKPLGVNVAGTEAQAAAAQQQGYALSDQRFAQRYPMLAAGKTAEINQIAQAQRGPVSPTVSNTLSATGLEQVPQGDEYQTAQQLGLPVLAKLQQDRANLNRIIAENPQRIGQLSGTQIATLMANNSKNLTSFNQQLFGINMNTYAGQVAQQNQNILAAGQLIPGLAQAGVQSYINQQNPFNLGTYQQGSLYGTAPVYGSVYNSPSYNADAGYLAGNTGGY